MLIRIHRQYDNQNILLLENERRLQEVLHDNERLLRDNKELSDKAKEKGSGQGGGGAVDR
jgi:hypothetical protein